MDSLNIICYQITYSPDTLRYFFSSVFQGYAAIFALGGMFYIYYSQTVDSLKDKKIEKIKDTLRKSGYAPTTFKEELAFDFNIINYFDTKIEPYNPSKLSEDPLKTVSFWVEDYKEFGSNSSEIRNRTKQIINSSIAILLISLISLFIVGLSSFFNIIAFIIGSLLILYSFNYFFKLGSLIKKIIYIFHMYKVEIDPNINSDNIS